MQGPTQGGNCWSVVGKVILTQRTLEIEGICFLILSSSFASNLSSPTRTHRKLGQADLHPNLRYNLASRVVAIVFLHPIFRTTLGFTRCILAGLPLTFYTKECLVNTY